MAAAQDRLFQAVRISARAGLRRREGEARVTLCGALLQAGRPAQALREADRAKYLVDSHEAARLHAQTGVILQRLGRLDAAVPEYRRALRAFLTLQQPADAARVRTNLGILQAYRGNIPAAYAELEAAERCYAELGLAIAAAEVGHNLGFVAALHGDVPTALSRYDAAAREFDRLDVPRPMGLIDRCHALLSVRIAGEARHLAAMAVEQLDSSGLEADLAEARLTLAQACLLTHEFEEAVRQSTLARRSFLRQNRPGWAVLARYFNLRAQWQQGGLGGSDERAARELAAELEGAGWNVAARDALLITARLAAQAGRLATAEATLSTASETRRRGPAAARVRAWYAEALLREMRGERSRAMGAVRAGLRVLEIHHAVLGATELRVHAAEDAEDLTALGMQLAVATGRPSTVLAWAERCRATTDRRPRARPPRDPELAKDLTALRRVVAEIEDAALISAGTSALLRRQVALESAVCRRMRQVPGTPGVRPVDPPSVREIAALLEDGVLVEYLQVAGDLYAVTVSSGRSRMWPIGPWKPVLDQVTQLRFGLARLARQGTSRASLAGAGAIVDDASRQLDRLLLGTVVNAVQDRPLVLIPSGVLHDLPWAALPSCRRRPITVAPSATQWVSARRRSPAVGDTRTVLVAGPGVASAEAEVSDLAPLHHEAVTLVGKRASVARVSAAISGVPLAHFAAHGNLRSDNAMFSSLQLADGPLTVYDLEGLRQAPSTVVLAACHLGASSLSMGDEILGFASTLLAMGTRTVVAGVAPVPDATSRAFMVEFHRRYLRGQGPAVALAEARTALQQDASASDPEAAQVVALAGFACLGAG